MKTNKISAAAEKTLKKEEDVWLLFQGVGVEEEEIWRVRGTG